MIIAVIDDKKEELEKAATAVKEAGHECVSILAGSQPLSSWIKRIEEADAIITDLHFDTRPHGFKSSSEVPAGLIVVIHASFHNKPVVICTNVFEYGDEGGCGHHSKTFSWLFDGYVASFFKEGKNTAPFGWEENKDWKKAIKELNRLIESNCGSCQE